MSRALARISQVRSSPCGGPGSSRRLIVPLSTPASSANARVDRPRRVRWRARKLSGGVTTRAGWHIVHRHGSHSSQCVRPCHRSPAASRAVSSCSTAWDRTLASEARAGSSATTATSSRSAAAAPRARWAAATSLLVSSAEFLILSIGRSTTKFAPPPVTTLRASGPPRRCKWQHLVREQPGDRTQRDGVAQPQCQPGSAVSCQLPAVVEH